MDLRQLRYFLTVAEELHFGRAAERLGIAQPPLTLTIQKLERELGCELFVRGRQTQLTEAGGKLAEEARLVLEQAEHAFEATRRIARGESGELRVGVPPSVMLTKLPDAIRKYRRRYPHVAFTLREMGTAAIERALLDRSIDLGFLRESKGHQLLKADLFLTEPLVAVLPAAHALAKQKTLRLQALRGEPFVFFPRRIGPAFHDVLLGECGDAGFVPNIVQEATQWQTVISLVEAGMGVTIAPACVEKFGWAGVVYRRLAGKGTRVWACKLPEAPAAVGNFLMMAGRA
ncbi:MAG: LysR substrate-binding domain-containing protein [Bryobacteraceae bacterium]